MNAIRKSEFLALVAGHDCQHVLPGATGDESSVEVALTAHHFKVQVDHGNNRGQNRQGQRLIAEVKTTSQKGKDNFIIIRHVQDFPDLQFRRHWY